MLYQLQMPLEENSTNNLKFYYVFISLRGDEYYLPPVAWDTSPVAVALKTYKAYKIGLAGWLLLTYKSRATYQ